MHRHMPRKDGFKTHIPDYSKEKDIVSYKVIQTGRKVKDGEAKDGSEDEYVLVEKVVEYDRKDRQEFINSFSDEVGVYNILAKCMTADGSGVDADLAAEALNQRKVSYGDISDLPDNIHDAVAIQEQSKAIYAALPEELKGKMTQEEFVQAFTDEKYQAYVATLKAQEQASEGGKKDGE